MKYLFSFLLLWIITPNAFSQKPNENNAAITVSVEDPQHHPKIGETVQFRSTKTKKTFTGKTKQNGKFTILLPKNDTYDIELMSFENDFKFNSLTIPNQKGMLTYQFGITYELPKTYVLKNVYFDTGKANLKASSFASLNNLAKLLKAKKTLIIEISGHTDNVGDVNKNIILSEQRAKAVKKYLLKKGIPSLQVQTKGYGDKQPIADNNTATGRKKNRRTEVKIIKE
jgi:outer membrane protein OmpA-like peptidoglycan-associated protein